MKKQIAEWLRAIADKITGEQTLDIAIAKRIEFETDVPKVKENECQQARNWVRESILLGACKALHEGALRWEVDITQTEATIGARLRIIRPKKNL